MATYLSLLRGVIQSLIDTLGELTGNPVTRLRRAHVKGEVILDVESVTNFQTSGYIRVGKEHNPIAYTGVVAIPTGQQFTGCDPLTINHAEDTAVSDDTKRYSAIGRLWRALTLTYSIGEDLSRLGRSMGLDRPIGVSDTIWRALLLVLGYLPAAPVDAIEMILDAVFPAGGWTIYESPVTNPCEVFITTPYVMGSTSEGRTFMCLREQITAVGLNTVHLGETPSSVESIVLAPSEDTLGMTVLPSVDTPPWTFIPELVGLEAAYFSITLTDTLFHFCPAGDSGRYQLNLPLLATEFNIFEAAWKYNAGASVGYPWHLCIEDGERQYVLIWTEAAIALGHMDGTVVAGPTPWVSGTGWHQMRVQRRNNKIYAIVDGTNVITADASMFNPSPNKLLSFGFINNAPGNIWTVEWDNVYWYTKSAKNYWNLVRTDGQMGLGTGRIQSPAGLWVASDVNKLIRLRYPNIGGSLVDGQWLVQSLIAANEFQLDGVPHTNGYASSLTPTAYYSYDRIFTPYDVTKTIRITGGPNAGDHVITSWVDVDEVQCAASSFVDQQDINWKFVALFNGEVNIPWKLVACGDLVGTTCTTRDNFPVAGPDVIVEYTGVLSGILMTNETVARGTAHPFYLVGTDEWLQKIISRMVTAAGIIPRYYRNY